VLTALARQEARRPKTEDRRPTLQYIRQRRTLRDRLYSIKIKLWQHDGRCNTAGRRGGELKNALNQKKGVYLWRRRSQYFLIDLAFYKSGRKHRIAKFLDTFLKKYQKRKSIFLFLILASPWAGD
jgi:hypothetical protein